MKMIDLFPSWFSEVPVISQLAEVLDEVWRTEVTEPAALLADIRDIQPNTEREILRRTVSMIGYNGRHTMLDDPRLYRLVTHLPVFRAQNSTEVYKSFLSFMLNHPVEVDNTWSEDYVAFFAVPEGPLLMDSVGNRLDEQGTGERGWYPTTHVILRCRPSTLFPNSQTPYQDMLDLFYKLAPAYVVVEHIGAVADLMQARLQINLGLIEGYSWKQHLSVYEQVGPTGDWQESRRLPVPLQQHTSEALVDTAYLLGGYTGRMRNENTVLAINKGGIEVEVQDPLFRSGADVTAMGSSNTLLVAGSAVGEISVSTNRGKQWEKVWSPFLNLGKPIVAVIYNPEQERWLVANESGTLTISVDGSNWTQQLYNTTALTGGHYGNGFYVLLPSTNGSVLRSLDGTAWTGTLVNEQPLIGSAYNPWLDQHIVVGSCARAWVSTDLINWSEINIGVGDYELTGIYACPHTHITCVYGPNAIFAYSFDLRQWFTPDTKFRAQSVELATVAPWLNNFMLFNGQTKTFARGGENSWKLHKYPLIETLRTEEIQIPRYNDRIVTETFTPTRDRPGWDQLDDAAWAKVDKEERTITRVVRDEFIEPQTRTVSVVGMPKGSVSPDRNTLIVFGTKGLMQVIRPKEQISAKTPMSQHRAGHFSFSSHNRYIYVMGGKSNDKFLNTCEIYDGYRNAWKYFADLPIPLSEAGCSRIKITTNNWAIRNPQFGSQAVNNVVYSPAAEMFYAVGTRGKISKSQYGIDWTEMQSPFPVQNIVAATYNPNIDVFFMFGNLVPTNLSAVSTSVDRGLTWKQTSINWPDPETINVADYIQRQPFEIILGGLHQPVDGVRPPNPMAIRLTGRSWIVDDVASVVPSSKSIYCGYFSNSYNLFVIGVDGGIVHSIDGAVWTYSPFVLTRNAYESRMPCLGVTECKGVILALRADGKRFISQDGGNNWSETIRVSDTQSSLDTTMAWDLAKWVRDDYYTDRTVSLTTSPDQQTMMLITPNGSIHNSTDLGLTWTLVQAVPPPGLTIVRRKIRYNPYVTAPAPAHQVAWTTGTHLNVSTDHGVSFTPSLISNDTYEESRAVGLCAVALNQWLVGGNRLWSVILNLPSLSSSPTLINEIQIRMPKGPAMKGSYVSGTLQEQDAQYQITCLDDLGEGRASDIFAIHIPPSTDGVGISLSWNRVPSARGYRLYGRRQGSMFLIAELSADATNFVDDGTTPLTLSVQLPTNDTSGLMGIPLIERLIVDIKYSTTTSCYYVTTIDGVVAYSNDLDVWYGVRNPAPILSLTVDETIRRGTDQVVITRGDTALTGVTEIEFGDQTGRGDRTDSVGTGILGFVQDQPVTDGNTASGVRPGQGSFGGGPIPIGGSSGSQDESKPAISGIRPVGGSFGGGPLPIGGSGGNEEIVPEPGLPPVDDSGIIGRPVETFPVNPDYIYGRGFIGVNELIMKESSSIYVVAGSAGTVGTSIDGTTWTYGTYAAGIFNSLAYDNQDDRLLLHTTTGQVAITVGNVALISPHLDIGISLPGGPFTGGLPIALYGYAVAPVKNGRIGVLSNWLHVGQAIANQRIRITIPVDRTRRNLVPDSYKLFRYVTTLGTPGPIQEQGIIPIGAGAETILYEDHGPSTGNSREFVGVGLNDLVWDDTGLTDLTLILRLEVTISEVAISGDSIRWRRNNGPWSDEIVIPGVGVPITLEFGVTVAFGAITGHTIRDLWSIIVKRVQVIHNVPVVNETATNLTEVWRTEVNGFDAVDLRTVFSQTEGAAVEFMAGGTTGVIRSADGITWVPAFEGLLRNVRCFTTGIVRGSPIFLFATTDGLYITRSYTETPTLVPVPMSDPIEDIIFNNTTKLFIAVGLRSQIMTSVNGVSWTLRPVPEVLGDLVSISIGDNRLAKLLAVGTQGTAYSSFDGRAWVNRDIGFSDGSIFVCLVDKTGTTDKMILAGDGGSIMYSDDLGATWESRPSSYDTTALTILCGVFVAPSTFILGGPTITRSTDLGDTWAAPADIPNLIGPPIKGMAANGPIVMFVTLQGARTYVSFDAGNRWSATGSVPEISEGRGIAFGAGWWVVVGPDGRFAYSNNDGATWRIFEMQQVPFIDRLYTPDSRQKIDFTAICFDGTHFILGGSQGDAFRILPTEWDKSDSMDVRFFGHPINCLMADEDTVIAGSHRGVMATRFYDYLPRQVVAGGKTTTGYSDNVYSYDPYTDTWTSLANLPAPRSAGALVTLADQTVLLIGGVNSVGEPKKTTYRYLPHKNIWIDGPELPYPKGWLTGHQLKNRWVCVIGGGIDSWYRTLFLSELVAPISTLWLKRIDGLLPAGVYSYRVTAVIGLEETVPTPVTDITIVNSLSGVSLDWQPVPGATEYRIYGRSPGALYLLAAVRAPKSSYVDTGVAFEITQQRASPNGTMSVERWYETLERMPLPRETFASCLLSNGSIHCSGGGADGRMWYFSPSESNIIRSRFDYLQDLLYSVDYVEDGYVTGE